MSEQQEEGLCEFADVRGRSVVASQLGEDLSSHARPHLALLRIQNQVASLLLALRLRNLEHHFRHTVVRVLNQSLESLAQLQTFLHVSLFDLLLQLFRFVAVRLLLFVSLLAAVPILQELLSPRVLAFH